jgi:hypothetical protein
MTGYNTFIQALTTCACGATGGCATTCAATFCAATQQNPDTACNTCLNNTLSPDAGGACLTPVETACTGNADCLALYGSTGCIATAGCNSK